MTIALSFLPLFLLPPLQLSHVPRAAPRAFQKVLSKHPPPALLPQPGWPPPCRAAKRVLLGRRGVPVMQLCLGTDVFTSLSVTEGAVSKLARVAWKKASGESVLLPSPLSLQLCVLSLFFFFPGFVHFAGIVFSQISSNLPPCHLLARADVGSWRRHGQDGGTSPFAGSRSLDQRKLILKPPTPNPCLFMLGSIPTAAWDVCIYGSASTQGMLHTSPESHISVCREIFAV